MGRGLLINEHVHPFACYQDREYQYDVGVLLINAHMTFTRALGSLLPACGFNALTMC